MAKARKVVLHFPQRLVDKPITYLLVKDYDLQFNILKASISPEEEGLLVLELSGSKSNYDEAIKFLGDSGVQVQLLAQDVFRRDDRCTHCGACVTMCPSGAFKVDEVTRRVEFINARCIVCGLCVKACPVRAMEVRL